MHCVVEGNCVKAFGKAVHALARLGDQMWFDPMDKGLALRSVNSAHSAYSCFLFSPLFFHQYNLTSGPKKGNEGIRCKLHIKAVLPLFRLPSIERTVERCQVSIEDDLVNMKFFCKHGIVRTHNLRFQECEALQAAFTSDLCPNVLKAPAKLLWEMVMHFPASQEEITLSVSSAKVSLRNYYEGGNGHMKMMHTEMSLHPDEFDYFQVGVESDITFCLKELRGLLWFAESHCLPVSIYFGAAGKPVCFSIEDMVLEATVVLATLMDSESRAASQHTPTPLQTTSRSAVEAVVTVHPQDTSVAPELVVSSQGSPHMAPPPLLLHLSHSDLPTFAPAPSPAPSMVCSLLFKAQSEDDSAPSPKVLVHVSDDEDAL
ncbi:cell cycle checkpoint control protein RAD9B [Eucyclogobius newberryi]|uniref:cell cycle checkpoint control protein RAD9B n=1 Tax=Eucyclogobius newberryi TaxID=166745 RepID=UPI003B5B9676